MKNGKNPFSEGVPELTRVSSKGQVVIPSDLRKKLHVKEGSVFAVSNVNGDMLILKKVKSPITKEDIETAKEIEESWKEIERGESTTMDADEFIEEIGKW
jgi:AbrB family looped-hinge helix DNA binding protein